MIQLIYDTMYQKHFLVDTDSNHNTGYDSLLDFRYITPADYNLDSYPNFTIVDSLPSIDDITSKYPELFI